MVKGDDDIKLIHSLLSRYPFSLFSLGSFSPDLFLRRCSSRLSSIVSGVLFLLTDEILSSIIRQSTQAKHSSCAHRK